MPYKDKEAEKKYQREYKKRWRERNRERWLKYQKEWQENNKNKTRDYSRKYYWANREKEIIRVMQGNKRRYRRIRLEVIEKYGGKCACCDEERIQFLGIDHIDGGGNKHRKEIGNRTIYEWLRSKKYPKGFQVLCHNCNLSKGFYGYCPHQVERGEIKEEDLKN